MALLAPVVLPLVYGSDFKASAGPACLLLAGLTGGVASGIVSAYLSGIGRPGLNSLAIGTGLVVTVVLDVLLIPRWHVMGAAAASTITYLTTTIALLVLFRRTSAPTAGSQQRPARVLEVAP
jgi:O-antigen/teichoic acid export membrane protein